MEATIECIGVISIYIYRGYGKENANYYSIRLNDYHKALTRNQSASLGEAAHDSICFKELRFQSLPKLPPRRHATSSMKATTYSSLSTRTKLHEGTLAVIPRHPAVVSQYKIFLLLVGALFGPCLFSKLEWRILNGVLGVLLPPENAHHLAQLLSGRKT